MTAKLPPDPKISAEDMRRFGFTSEFAAGIDCARKLFEKLRETRNAISHFLINTEPVNRVFTWLTEHNYDMQS
jgi:hypothetical protein